MADIKSSAIIQYTNDESRDTMKLLFYAYRDFTGVANVILEKYDLGCVHHRIIYFVRQCLDMTVSELLTILKITKQSLNRVLSKLIDDGFVVQGIDKKDKRKCSLGLTLKGIDLKAILTKAQTDFIQKVYDAFGSDADIPSFKSVLMSMMDEPEQRRFKGVGTL